LILYTIPTPLGGSPDAALPTSSIATVRSLRDFVVENAKSARAFLGALGMPVRSLSIKVIGEEPDPLAPLREKRPLGVLSEAGCPAIADPAPRWSRPRTAKASGSCRWSGPLPSCSR
jgi:16S rRNA (cytidine1402-2'-O)-methyltransferase